MHIEWAFQIFFSIFQGFLGHRLWGILNFIKKNQGKQRKTLLEKRKCPKFLLYHSTIKSMEENARECDPTNHETGIFRWRMGGTWVVANRRPFVSGEHFEKLNSKIKYIFYSKISKTYYKMLCFICF